MNFKVKETQKVYHGSRFVVYRDFIEQPDGSEVAREVVATANAAAVVPLTADGEVIMIRQFRYPTAGSHPVFTKDGSIAAGAVEQTGSGYLWEIPAGVLDEGEKPEKCAEREVEEETGYRAGKLTWLGKIHTSPGICSETIDLYLAEEMQEGDQDLEHGEIIEPKAIKFEDAFAMIADGEITDAKTICGLLLALKVIRDRA